jgi:hypothetical protein
MTIETKINPENEKPHMTFKGIKYQLGASAKEVGTGDLVRIGNSWNVIKKNIEWYDPLNRRKKFKLSKEDSKKYEYYYKVYVEGRWKAYNLFENIRGFAKRIEA